MVGGGVHLSSGVSRPFLTSGSSCPGAYEAPSKAASVSGASRFGGGAHATASPSSTDDSRRSADDARSGVCSFLLAVEEREVEDVMSCLRE